MWPAGTRPSDAQRRRRQAPCWPNPKRLKANQVELFIHAAVSRDMLEPATGGSFAHRKIGLPAHAQIFDVSNACLGFLNSLTVAAGLIESGQIKCALVVAGENGGPLVEQTLTTLLERPLNRNEIKPYFANLTIGSGAVAAIVCHRSLVKGQAHRLLGGVGRAATQHSDLCQGDTHGAESLAMQTDSEQLLIAGVALAQETWSRIYRRRRLGREVLRPFYLPSGRQHAPPAAVRKTPGWISRRISRPSRRSATPVRSPCPPRSPPRSMPAPSARAAGWDCSPASAADSIASCSPSNGKHPPTSGLAGAPVSVQARVVHHGARRPG